MENGKWHHKTKPRLHSLVALPEFSHQKKEENVFWPKCLKEITLSSLIIR